MTPAPADIERYNITNSSRLDIRRWKSHRAKFVYVVPKGVDAAKIEDFDKYCLYSMGPIRSWYKACCFWAGILQKEYKVYDMSNPSDAPPPYMEDKGARSHQQTLLASTSGLEAPKNSPIIEERIGAEVDGTSRPITPDYDGLHKELRRLERLYGHAGRTKAIRAIHVAMETDKRDYDVLWGWKSIPLSIWDVGKLITELIASLSTVQIRVKEGDLAEQTQEIIGHLCKLDGEIVAVCKCAMSWLESPRRQTMREVRRRQQEIEKECRAVSKQILLFMVKFNKDLML